MRTTPVFAPRLPSAAQRTEIPSTAAPFVPPELPREAFAAYQEAFAQVAGDEPAPIPHALPIHPEANRYEMLTVRRLQEMSRDIAAKGQQEPIVLHQGAVLDGRNRLAACLLSGVRPRFCPWDGGGGSEAGYVESLNRYRRHLSPAQLAALAVRELPRLAEAARGRMGPGHRPRELAGGDDPSPPCKRDEGGRAVVQAAASVGAGVSATKALAAAKKADPRIVELAGRDRVSVEQAKTLTGLDAPSRDKAIARIEAGEKADAVLPKGLSLTLALTNEEAEPEDPALLRGVAMAVYKYAAVEGALEQVLGDLDGQGHARTRVPTAKLLREVRAERAALQRRLDAAPYLRVPCPACGQPIGRWCVRNSGGFAAMHSERLAEGHAVNKTYEKAG